MSILTDAMCRYSCPEPFGTGVYLLASVFDHSCTPNCTVVFLGREIVVMATAEIPAGDIAEVAFISYINTIDDTATRRLQQRAIWYFQCQCSLCANLRYVNFCTLKCTFYILDRHFEF